jgi:hypothetical protein
MVGIFERFYNHQGELRWRFLVAYEGAVSCTAILASKYPKLMLHCNIKRHPRIGTYCKAPANYMRG